MSSVPSFLPRLASSSTGITHRPGQPTVTLQNGQLRVVGTKKADEISVVRRGDVVEVRSRGELIGALPASQVSSVDVKGGKGDDRIAVDVGAQIAVRIDGGRGNDAIRIDRARDAFVHGGRGHDRILGRDVVGGRFVGGRGHDVIDLVGARGSIVEGGRGDDRLRLVGGRNNTLRGGAGNDALLLRGTRDAHLDGGPGIDCIDVGAAPRVGHAWARVLREAAAFLQRLQAAFAGLSG